MLLRRKHAYRRRSRYQPLRKRLPFRARRRYGRRRNYRRKTSGNFIVQGRITTNYSFPADSEDPYVQIAPQLNQFPEFVFLSNNFEAYKIMSCSVKVTPTSNVSPTDHQVPHYVSAPWHKPIITPKTCTLENLLTIDRSREYHGNAQSRRHYVPAIEYVSQVGTNLTNTVLRYRPRIEIRDNVSVSIPHYCGLYAFVPSDDPVIYQFVISIKVLFMNQKSGLQ